MEFLTGFVVGVAIVCVVIVATHGVAVWRIKRNGGAIWVEPGKNHAPYTPTPSRQDETV